MAVGGDFLEIAYNHPTIGSGRMFPKSGEDSTLDPGGIRSADDANMVAANGEMIDQMNRVRWSLEATITNDANTRKDLENVVAMAASPVPATWTATHINGTIYRGVGKPVGDLQANFNAATFTLKLAGGGAMKQV